MSDNQAHAAASQQQQNVNSVNAAMMQHQFQQHQSSGGGGGAVQTGGGGNATSIPVLFRITGLGTLETVNIINITTGNLEGTFAAFMNALNCGNIIEMLSITSPLASLKLLGEQVRGEDMLFPNEVGSQDLMSGSGEDMAAASANAGFDMHPQPEYPTDNSSYRQQESSGPDFQDYQNYNQAARHYDNSNSSDTGTNNWVDALNRRRSSGRGEDLDL